jgi:hypothetical protein
MTKCIIIDVIYMANPHHMARLNIAGTSNNVRTEM